MSKPIVEAWQTHCRLNQNFLDHIPAEGLGVKLGGRGRTVGAIIAHMHNNRLAWLEPGAPDLYAGQSKVKREQTGDKDALLAALAASGTAVAGWLARSLENGGKVKGFGGQAASFLGYLIAHESYHHGEIGLILGQTGFPLDKTAAYGLWQWR